MRLIASSNPDDVKEAEAQTLLCERLALANAVCHALEDDSGQLISATSRAALDLLRGWVGDHYPHDGPETRLGDGLEQMRVPPGDEALYKRLLAATHVCGRLAWLYTADTYLERQDDSRELEAALEWWRGREQQLLPPPSRPARSSLQVLALDYAHGDVDMDKVVETLLHGPDDHDEPPWLPGMNDWTGIAYLQSAGHLTEEQIKPLRDAYNVALLTLTDESDPD